MLPFGQSIIKNVSAQPTFSGEGLVWQTNSVEPATSHPTPAPLRAPAA